jgi:hypothetical protein
MVPLSQILDVQPSRAGQQIDIAVRFDGESSAYAFNAESYRVQDTKRPWCLPEFELAGRDYALKINLCAGSIETTRVLRLVSGNTLHDFRLEEFDASDEERWRQRFDARGTDVE